MKKIFAIALALVMVFAMASAFALSDCATVNFAWTCPATYSWCGKAAVEVVPYVHTNAACNGDEYVVSDCATAIKGEFVYYAVKLTVEANPFAAWFNKDNNYTTTFSVGLKTAGLVAADSFGDETDEDGYETIALTDVVSMTADKEVVYYLANDGQTWVEAKNADFVVVDTENDEDNVIFKAEVAKAAVAEVCAEIESMNDGYDTWTYGKWTVAAEDDSTSADAGVLTFTKGGKSVVITYTADGIVSISGSATELVAVDPDVFAEMVSTFKFNNCAIGTCITDKNIKANFGWDDEQEDCFAWSTKGMAVVDTDCVVAIPKTGDVSVVAYAVMAVAAAAGMLKK